MPRRQCHLKIALLMRTSFEGGKSCTIKNVESFLFKITQNHLRAATRYLKINKTKKITISSLYEYLNDQQSIS